MNQEKILSEFYDFYIKVHQEEVLEIYPSKLQIKLPISFQAFVDATFPQINEQEKELLLKFYKKKEVEENLNFKAEGKWYSIDYRKIDDENYLHLYSSERSLKGLDVKVTLAQLDPLSGLLHKSAITSYITQRLESDHCSHATIFMLDIDYFKNINDNFGHAFGDLVIIEVAKILKELSKRAKVGRIGGDEFIIFLEEKLDRDGIKNVARLIRYLLDKLIIKGNSFPVTATIGITQYPDNGTTFDVLFNCCDKALYRGKQKGRDCHIIYDEVLHGKINAALPKTTSSNVKVLSIAGFIKRITDTLLDKPASKMDYNHIFKHICDYFNLDRILMIDDSVLCAKYEQLDSKLPVDVYKEIDLESYTQYFLFDNMFMVNDVNTLRVKDEQLYEIYMKAGVKSFVQVLLFDKMDRVIGFISYEVLSDRRVWQTAELNYLVIISNLLKGFISEEES